MFDIVGPLSHKISVSKLPRFALHMCFTCKNIEAQNALYDRSNFKKAIFLCTIWILEQCCSYYYLFEINHYYLKWDCVSSEYSD